MKKITIIGYLFLLVTALFSNTEIYSQEYLDKQAKLITEQGIFLYKLEKGAWLGTDLFFEKFGEKKNLLGGYVTYPDKKNTKVVFYSNEKSPKVIATILFDESFDLKKVKLDTKERNLTKNENDLRLLREKSLFETRTNSTFEFYKNTGFNIIPIIQNEKKEVYILSGPKTNDVIIFGNDYLLTFDNGNNIKNVKKIHKNIIFQEFKKINDSVKFISAVHTHLPESGDFMTATDICTIMLYGEKFGLENSIVHSENYVSIWDIKTKKLSIVEREKYMESLQNKNVKN